VPAQIDIAGDHSSHRKRRSLKLIDLDVEAFALMETQVLGEPINGVRQCGSRRRAHADAQFELAALGLGGKAESLP
jgi:hypothetical protein